MAQHAPGADDAAIVRQTRNLIEYVREIVRATHRPVRDCGQYQDRLWLSSLPTGVTSARDTRSSTLLKVQHLRRTAAPPLPAELVGWISSDITAKASRQDPPLAAIGPGSGWTEDENGDPVEITEIAIEDAPQVRQTYRRWLAAWRRWANAELAAEPYRKLHRRLRRMDRQLRDEGDVYEVVLGIGMLAHGGDERQEKVRRHLFTAPLSVAVDSRSNEITVSLAAGAGLRLEDTDFLEESDGYSTELLSGLRERLESGEIPHPLSREVDQLLVDWADQALGEHAAVRFDPAWEPPEVREGPGFSLRPAPAVLLRERGRGALVGFYEKIAERLAKSGAKAPLGLARLIVPPEVQESDGWSAAYGRAAAPALGPDPLFPLATNAAQRDVLARLQRDTGVVVQGPPGTGKTHTIANLTCALLADGKRVLVTSEKDQALRVLRDKLPPALRGLCVLQGDPRRGGNEELDKSIRALSRLHATTTPERLTERAKELDAQRTELGERRALLRNELRDLREVEWREYTQLPEGYQGQLVQVVEAVSAGQDRYDWLPTLPISAAEVPPIDGDEARRLMALIERHGPGVLDEHGTLCPDPAQLPSTAQLADALHTLAAAERARLDDALDPLADALAAHGPELVAALHKHLHTASAALQRAGLSQDVSHWDPAEWHTKALRHGLAGQKRGLWDVVRQASAEAEEVQRSLIALSHRHVEVPSLTTEERVAMIATGQTLWSFVDDGGKLRSFGAWRIRRAGRRLLEECRVDGHRPDNAEDLAAILTQLRAEHVVMELNNRWQDVGAPGVSGSAHVALAELLDRNRDLAAVDAFTVAGRAAHDELLLAAVQAAVRTPNDWEALRVAVTRAERALTAAAAERTLRGLADTLPQPGPRGGPELAEAHRALAARDVAAYEEALAALDAAYLREADRREARKLLGRLAEGHSELARQLTSTPTAPHWNTRLPALAEAWSWRQSHAFTERMLDEGREGRLDGELAEVEGRLKETVEQLAATRALWHCLDRLTIRQKQALSSYADAMARAGSRTSPSARRHLRNARSAMRDAMGAVPAWVMPVKQAAATLPPEPDSFDVVIVDEASQVGLDGLMLLWLAPRVIIVGDDRQCVPAFLPSNHERLRRRLDDLLPDLGDWQRDALDPNGSNLYALLRSRYTEVIMLTEHFRCMPEIIQWSSHQFYGKDLVPLRQYGADRLRPLQVVHVPEGHCEGFGDRLVNRPEAERLVAKLKELTQDPAYAERTFGVIPLRSGAPARLIDDLIDNEIEPDVRERHRIRVGVATDFQGDERDVMLLSTVVDGDHIRKIRSLPDGRRFNVAASRARDQMWLFTSVTTDQLPSDDLRHTLITHMRSPAPTHQPPPELDAVPDNEKRDPFDSLFEQRVFRKIGEHGYHVVPQWRVGEKRIDLVVTGEHARLAVECDGSPHHWTSRQIQEDYERERELRRAGWNFWRVRSSTFALDPEEALAPLWERLELMGIQPGTTEEFAGGEAPETWTPVELDENAPDSEDYANQPDTGQEGNGYGTGAYTDADAEDDTTGGIDHEAGA
ncbi:AAA domain-containing protein [Streptomyces sp. LHD-70]|uniref:AAA domain-containing protein n=1 Tax=Streptomyces sp. LHD-70 TaxID=3072140 RepID=UPI00280E2972|nr:AAA domain-containing protein [Streptomyces sp. LHD-70]MDQ8703551.1 AAA domain-containing protein [Streptomyces sp. LHD-70]